MDITENNECVDSIGDVTSTTPAVGPNLEVEDQEIIIERDCVANAIGRYVYITPQDSSPFFGFCEVRLYGSDGKINSHTFYYRPSNFL